MEMVEEGKVKKTEMTGKRQKKQKRVSLWSVSSSPACQKGRQEVSPLGFHMIDAQAWICIRYSGAWSHHPSLSLFFYCF